MHLPRRALCAAAFGLSAALAQADGVTGNVTLTSDRVERGLSQSGGSVSLGADLAWSHPAGFYAGLGVATIDDDAFGGAKLRWSPSTGWRVPLGGDDLPAELTLGLSAQLYPGALGRRTAALPPRLADRAQARETDFATAELKLALSAAGFSLALDRSLMDYQGIASESNRRGARQAASRWSQGSSGSLHLALTYRREFDAGIAAWASAERQTVAHFRELDCSGWRLGASAPAGGLTWALEAHASHADANLWRVQRASGESRSLVSRGATASVAWAF